MGEASPESGAAEEGEVVQGLPLLLVGSQIPRLQPHVRGDPRSIPQVPSYVMEEPGEELMAQGHNLRQFKYACAGYSMFVVDNRGGQSGVNEGKALLPYCQGLELPLTLGNKDRDLGTSRDWNSGGGKFTRSSGLVASGVAKNLNKTANYIKENIEDIYNPDRQRPK